MDIRCFHGLGFLLCAAALPADLSPFKPGSAIAIAEPLPDSFSIVVADANRDRRLDLLVGSSAGIVVLLNEGESRFAPGRLAPTPADCGPVNMRTGDFDQDIALDVAAYCFTAGLVLIYRGDGAGAFELTSRIALKTDESEARGITAADLNQDGIPDLAVGQSGNITVLFGKGDGTFEAADELPIGGLWPGSPAAIVAADFNGDGIPDLAAVNLVYNDDLSVLLGAGGGRFGREEKMTLRCRPYDLATVDYNRDGSMDLAVACDDGLVLLAGKGDGSFTSGPRERIESSSLSVAAGDLNADGLTDFVLGNYYGGEVSILLGQEDGTVSPVDPVWAVGDVFSIALADVNGDGVSDLAGASYSGSSALFAVGRGNGQFEPPTYFGTSPANTFPLRAADLDADGAADLAVIAEGRRSIALFRRGSEAMSMIWRSDYPVDAGIADFNGDGIPDLALAAVQRWSGRLEAEFGAAIKVVPGLRGGGFGSEITTAIEQCGLRCDNYAWAGGMLRLGIGDFSGDRLPDLALFNAPLEQIQIYAGNGDGSFRLTDGVASRLGRFITGDFDGDGVTDLAALSGDGSAVSTFTGSSTSPLRETGKYSVCRTFGPDMAMGDFNGDAKPDLAVYCGNEAAILLNAGSGKFHDAAIVTAGPEVAFRPAAIADFNQDGKDDLLAVSSTGLALLLSKGDGSFGAPIHAPAPRHLVSMIGADFTGDPRPDVAFVDASDGTLRIQVNDLANVTP